MNGAWFSWSRGQGVERGTIQLSGRFLFASRICVCLSTRWYPAPPTPTPNPQHTTHISCLIWKSDTLNQSWLCVELHHFKVLPESWKVCKGFWFMLFLCQHIDKIVRRNHFFGLAVTHKSRELLMIKESGDYFHCDTALCSSCQTKPAS